ncbi:MAG TPA: PQQ-binding-like beta-propeller repeat protein [Candidatus Xenobia bacterium]|jgi:serine/threonine protein kinase
MQCTTCGEVVDDNPRRCPSCFSYLSPEGLPGVHEGEVGGRFCVRCGKKNELRSTECGRCGRGLESFLLSATIVDLRYLVLATPAILPQAGYVAIDMEKEEPCSVKIGVLHDCQHKDEIEAAGRRFALARTCEHPNLIRLREFSIETRAGYVVFDAVQGRDMETMLVMEGMPWLPEERAVNLLHQMLQALDYLQNKRPMVVLAELSPERVAVDDDDVVKVLPLDWRDAKLGAPGRHPYRAADSHLGQPSATWDVYTVSALFHHLLTGQSPVSREQWDFPAIRGYNPQLSEDLERIIARGLSAHHLRYPSASYVDAELVLAFPPLKEPTAAAPRPPRPRPRTTGTLTMAAPGRFSKAISTDSDPPSTGGRGLLRAATTSRLGGGMGFRRLKTPGDSGIAVEQAMPAPATAPAQPARPARLELPPPRPALPPVWQRVAPTPTWIHGIYGSILPDFLMADKRIVVGTWDGALRGLSPNEGERVWEARAGKGTWYALTLFGGQVAAQLWSLPTTPEDRPRFVCLNLYNLLDGSRRWSLDKLYPAGTGLSHMAVVDDLLIVYFANAENTATRLVALDVEGKASWSRDFTGQTEWGGTTAHGVCLWHEGKGVMMLEPATGETRWSHPEFHVWRPTRDRAPALPLSDGHELVVLQDRTVEGLEPLVGVSTGDGEVGWHRCLGPMVGSYLDTPPCLVTTSPKGVVCSVAWEFRNKFRHSLFQLDPLTGLPAWAVDLRTPLHQVLPFAPHSPVLLASTPIRQNHTWGPFAHYRTEIPCYRSALDNARPRLGSSPMRALDPESGRELWRSGKQEAEALSFHLQASSWQLVAAGSDGRLHAYTWYEG